MELMIPDYDGGDDFVRLVVAEVPPEPSPYDRLPPEFTFTVDLLHQCVEQCAQESFDVERVETFISDLRYASSHMFNRVNIQSVLAEEPFLDFVSLGAGGRVGLVVSHYDHFNYPSLGRVGFRSAMVCDRSILERLANKLEQTVSGD